MHANKQTNKQRETQYFLEGCQSSWTPKRPIGGLTDKGDHQGLSLARDPTSRRHTAHIPWFIRRYSSIRQFIRPFIRSNLRVISSNRQSAISDRQSVCMSAVVFGTETKVWNNSNRLPTRRTLLSAVFGQQRSSSYSRYRGKTAAGHRRRHHRTTTPTTTAATTTTATTTATTTTATTDSQRPVLYVTRI
jgi:hypothetical protein